MGHCSPLIAVNTFKDIPWLNIPLHRRAEIRIEPLFPQGGLFGGSPDSAPKASKLSALAAARRKKENEKPDGSASKNLPSNSIALLGKLDGSHNPDEGAVTNSFDITKNASLLPKRENNLLPTIQSRRFPLRRRKSHSPSKSANIPKSALLEPEIEKCNLEMSAPIIETPSLFARTMLGPTLSNELSPTASKLLPTFFSPFYASELNHAGLNNFAGPSPDDIVSNAQKSKGLIKAASRSRRRGTN